MKIACEFIRGIFKIHAIGRTKQFWTNFSWLFRYYIYMCAISFKASVHSQKIGSEAKIKGLLVLYRTLY